MEGVAAIERHIVALDVTVQGWDKRFESLEGMVRDGFEKFDHLLRPVLKTAASARRQPGGLRMREGAPVGAFLPLTGSDPLIPASAGPRS